MTKLVFLDRATLPVALRAPVFPHTLQEFDGTAIDEVVARLAGAEVAICNKTPLRTEQLAQLPQLKLIAVTATGVNNVDLEHCRAHGIAVANVSGYSTHSVAEHVFAGLLALRRNLLSYRREVEAGAWQRSPQFCLFSHPLNDLHGSTLGMIGHGAIGQAVAQLAQAFGMRVLVAERKGAPQLREGRLAFDEVLAQADVLSLHCPLTEDTRNLIGSAELRRMKPTAILVNAARGGIVDEQALADSLRTGRIAGAVVDVLSEEPPRNGNPLLALAAHPGLMLTPHVAWASQQAMALLAEEVVRNIEAYQRGESRNRIV